MYLYYIYTHIIICVHLYIYINNPIEISSFNSHSHGHFFLSEMDLLGLQKRSQQQMRSCHGGGIGHLGAGWASERAIVVASEYTNKRAGVTEIIHMILRYLKKFYNHLEISRICAKIQCNIMYNNN